MWSLKFTYFTLHVFLAYNYLISKGAESRSRDSSLNCHLKDMTSTKIHFMKQTSGTAHKQANEWRIPNATRYRKKITFGNWDDDIESYLAICKSTTTYISYQRDDEQNISHQGHPRSLACR